MSLWGKKDGADIWDGSSGQSYTCTSGDVEVVFSASIASHNPEVGDVLILDANGYSGGPHKHRITQLVGNDTVHVTPALTHTVGSGDEPNYYAELQECPRSVHTDDLSNTIGVSTTETDALPTFGGGFIFGAGVTHSGWLKKHTKTRDGVTSTWFETLVATSSITDDVTGTDIQGTA